MAEGEIIKGASAAKLSAAAAAALAKAEAAGTAAAGEVEAAEVATTEVRRARAHMEDAERALKDLEKEWDTAKRANKKLSDTQRRWLDEIAKAGDAGLAPGAQPLGQQASLKALERRGLIARSGKQVFITNAGRGVHDPSLVAGDIEQQIGYIQRLNDQAARDLQEAVREEKKTAEANATAAKKTKTAAKNASVALPAGPAAAQQKWEKKAAEQAAAWDKEMDKFIRRSGNPAEEIAQLLSLERTDSGRFQVHGPLVGGRRGGYAREGGSAGVPRTKTFKSEEAAQRELHAIAEEIAGDETRAARVRKNAGEEEARAVEKAEERKTTAVEQGAKKRTRARKQEGEAAAGNTAEFSRRIAESAELLASELTAEQRAGVDAQMQKTEPAQQKAAAKKLKKAAKAVKDAPPPPPPPPPPPAPPGPPDDSDERRRLVQKLRDALAKRAAQQEELERIEAQEIRDRKVAREVARRKNQAEIRAAASAELAAEKLAARVAPEHEETRQRVQQDRLDRRLNRARERQARQAEEAANAEATARRAQAQRLTDALAQRRQTLVQDARAAGADQYPTPIGPRRPTAAEAMRAAGADQYVEAIGPRPPTRKERGEVDRARRRQEAASAKVEEDAATMAEATRLSNDYAAAQARLGSQLEKTAISADLASQRFRKHGALTTEFIEAAAKGEVTVGELGYQLTATVGKFAGWTAAASAVYGVVGALSQVAEGAVAASSAVGLVGRVVTENFDQDKLQSGLIDFSQKFNVPIQDVADAVYGAGKTFHDLPSALKASESALFAMKVGELDSARATEALTAIVNGFKLQASDLPGVFDTINQAQNRFGGNVGQLTLGVAKAGGQFRAAGGDYQELIAILTAGARLTGASAEEVATAVGRSASVLRTPAGAARARKAGLDPTRDPLAVLQQAQELAKGQGPERVQELARALVPAGGQFARIFVPLIQNAELLNNVLAETAPEKAKGSAQRELAKVLSQANEQLGAVANNLQGLGAALAQSGLLAPLGVLLKGVNETIQGVTKLVGLFTSAIPDPFKPWLATILELYGVLRLLRRFDIGGNIAPGGRIEPLRQFISASPERTSRRQILQGIGAERKFLVDTRERAGQGAAVAAFRERAAAERLAAAISGGNVDLVKRRSQALARASEQAADLAEEEGDLRRLINDNDRRRVETLKNIRGGMPPEQALIAAGGSYRTAGVDRPTTQGPVRVIGSSPGGVLLPATRQLGAAAKATGEAEREMSGFRQAMARVGVSGRAAGATADGVTGAMRGAKSGLQSAAAGIGRMGATMVETLGWLDIALIGVAVIAESVNQFHKEAEKHTDRLKRATQPSSDPEQLQRQLDDLNRSDHSFKPIDFLTGIVMGPGAPEHTRSDDPASRELEARIRDQRAQRRFGRGLGTSEIQDTLASDESLAATPKQQVAALQKALTALDQGYAALYGAKDLDAAKKKGDKDAEAAAQAVVDRADAARAQIVSGLNALATAGSAVDQAINAAKDFKGLQDFVDQQGARLELRGGRAPVRAIGKTGLRAAQLYAQGNDTAAYLKFLKDQEDAIVAPAEDRLKRALDVAKSPAQRNDARQQFIGSVRQGLGIGQLGRDQDLIAVQQADRQRRINLLELKKQMAATGPAVSPLTGVAIGGLPAGLSTTDDSKLTALKQDVANANKVARALGLNLTHKKKLLADIKRAQDDADFEEAQATFEAETAVGAARQPAGAARIIYQLGRIATEMSRAIRKHGRHSREVLTLLGEQLSLQAEQVNEELASIQAAAGLAEAQATTPAGEYSARIGGLNKTLSKQREHPEVFKPSQIVQTQTEIAQAKKAENQRIADEAKRRAEDAKQAAEEAKRRREEAEQRARELLDAKYEYMASLTDDPVKLAKLEEEHANKVLARGGLDGAERYRALAARNQARRNRVNTINQRRADELDLRHDIGKLSDEQYLDGLDKLWRRMGKGTQAWRDMRAKILRAKHDMEEGSDMPELNVGNIRMPTVYDVRRMIGQGTQSSAVVQNTVVHVDARGQDPAAISAHINRTIGNGTKSGLRAAGMRG